LNRSSDARIGAKALTLAPVPQDCSIFSKNALNLSGGSTKEKKWA
jgi:hypothetical protein